MEEILISYLIPLWSTQQCSVFSMKTTIVIAIFKQIIHFGHQISPGNVSLCCKDMHPLLLECFLTPLYRYKCTEDPLRKKTIDPLQFTEDFSAKNKTQVWSKIIDHRYDALSIQNGMLFCHKRRVLLPKCSPTFLYIVCIQMVWRASDSISNPPLYVQQSQIPNKITNLWV